MKRSAFFRRIESAGNPSGTVTLVAKSTRWSFYASTHAGSNDWIRPPSPAAVAKKPSGAILPLAAPFQSTLILDP